MEEIKLWTIEGSQVSQVQQNNQMDSEEHLEEILVENPELLMPGLTLVGRQTQTTKGPLDLLGVDSDGRLVVFELKRDKLSRDAVAQIIDYTSDLENMDPDDLFNHISDNSGTYGIKEIDDFEKWYTENYEDEDLGSIWPLRMFLVGLGFDDTTERMVNFLAQNGLDLSLLTFYSFEQDGKTLLARLRVVGDDDDSLQVRRKRRRTRRSQEEFRELLDSRVKEYGISDLFGTIKKMFNENWPRSEQKSNEHGLRFLLTKQNDQGKLRKVHYARIDPNEKVGVVFFRDSITLCVDEFRPLIKEIPFQTWPKNREANALEDLDAALENDLEIQFQLTEEDWETHKEKLHRLTLAVYDAQQSRIQGD